MVEREKLVTTYMGMGVAIIFGIAGVGDAHLDLLAHVCEVLEDEEALEMMKKTPDIKFVLTHLQ